MLGCRAQGRFSPSSSLPPCGGGLGRGVCTGGSPKWRMSVRESSARHRLKASVSSGGCSASVKLPATSSAAKSQLVRSSSTSLALSVASLSRSTAVRTTSLPGVTETSNVIAGSALSDFAYCAWRTARCSRTLKRCSSAFAHFLEFRFQGDAPPPPRPSPVKGEGDELLLLSPRKLLAA